MDLTRVIQNEEERQRLISEQEGNGIFNPLTGTYKWGVNVYDLTKTGGRRGAGWLPMNFRLSLREDYINNIIN